MKGTVSKEYGGHKGTQGKGLIMATDKVVYAQVKHDEQMKAAKRGCSFPTSVEEAVSMFGEKRVIEGFERDLTLEYQRDIRQALKEALGIVEEGTGKTKPADAVEV